jgi:hypothetical protein
MVLDKVHVQHPGQQSPARFLSLVRQVRSVPSQPVCYGEFESVMNETQLPFLGRQTILIYFDSSDPFSG